MSNFLLADPDAVFIHIPKTGGSTIRIGIWERNYTGPEFGEIPSDWNKHFKFAFVRHPLERLASAYRDFRDIRRFEGGFDKFLDLVLDDSIPYGRARKNVEISVRHHTIPQTHPFNCLDQADFVGRYENYEDDLNEILKAVGKQVVTFPRMRHTKGETFQELFKGNDAALSRMVEYYQGDFETLGYDAPIIA
ncbi:MULTISPECIES: sulfotransferase family 2 domain-containing protein [unclassified Ruegeria]|uniref:sulfotransferase family 2 domain-containing protein n=1 Tax=unclassified Ruegeria TaxID=2625375 RepID=UPI001489DEB7|nr:MULTISPECIES: sulfotransferase family 2 domain-containing protein [unclassified Ruegeria]